MRIGPPCIRLQLGHYQGILELVKIDEIDLNAKDSPNEAVGDLTALHLAMMHNRTDVHEALLMYPGCDVNNICYCAIKRNGKNAEGFN